MAIDKLSKHKSGMENCKRGIVRLEKRARQPNVQPFSPFRNVRFLIAQITTYPARNNNRC